jgi:hypothetical protein
MRVEMRYLRQDVAEIKAELKVFTSVNLEARVKSLEMSRDSDADTRVNERKEIRQFVFNVAVGIITLTIGGFITLYLSHFGINR